MNGATIKTGDGFISVEVDGIMLHMCRYEDGTVDCAAYPLEEGDFEPLAYFKIHPDDVADAVKNLRSREAANEF